MRYTFRGHRVDKPTRYATKDEAKPFLAQLKQTLLAEFWAYERPADSPGNRRGPAEITLGKLAEDYCGSLAERGKAENTVTTTPSRLWSIVKALGQELPAHLVDDARMDEWLAMRRKSKRLVRGAKGEMRPSKQTISETTIHNEEGALRTMFKWAIRKRLVVDPDDARRPLRVVPWAFLPEDKPTPRTHRPLRIPDDLVLKLANGLQPDKNEADLYVMLGLLTGARGEDLGALEWENWTGTAWEMAEEERQEDSGTSKTGQVVIWPMPPKVAAFLNRIEGEGRVFDPPPSYGRLRRRTKAICGAPSSVKSFRHTISSGLAAAKVHPKLAKAILAHSMRRSRRSEEVSLGYIHPTEEELLEAIMSLWWAPILSRRATKWGRTGAKAKTSAAG